MFSYDFEFTHYSNAKSTLKAFGKVIIDGVFLIDGFSIFDGQYGMYVKPPQDVKKGEGDGGKDKYIDKVRFLDEKEEGEKYTPLQKEMYDAMLAAYVASTASTSTGSSRAEAAAAQATGQAAPASARDAMKPKRNMF